MKILIIALSGIGDAIMFSPSLSLLKKSLPESQIDLLVMFPQVKEIYETNANVSNIYFIDFLKQSKLKSLKQVLSLRKNKYDHSINIYPSNRKEYNIINYLIGAEQRIATKYLNYSKSNLDILNTMLKLEIKNRHNVLENFDLIKLIVPSVEEGDISHYEIYLNPEEESFAKKFVNKNNLHQNLLVGFHAGSATFKRHINKRWDSNKFAELARLLNRKHNAFVLLFGTEKDVNEKIYNQTKEISLIPNTNKITESMALIKKCQIFISNDTALMHLASALQIPTVCIFGYTNHNELHPWMSKYAIIRKDLECSPCFFNSPNPVNCIYSGDDEFKCVKTIEVEDVLSAAEKLIQEIPGYVKS